MFRGWNSPSKKANRFPRVRGDVPKADACSFLGGVVFPACAGMFLSPKQIPNDRPRFPRVRGDVPYLGDDLAKGVVFSPRARGCSAPRLGNTPGDGVFPACAGMFHLALPSRWDWWRFPRVRGDVPLMPVGGFPVALFSPRARGCSFLQAALTRGGDVFPACAGMFRSSHKGQAWIAGFPRVRGDVPAASKHWL